MPKTYPVSLVLEGQKILVVGGGSVATRKVMGLIDYPIALNIVSPKLSETLQHLIDNGRCTWRRDTYNASDLENVDIVFVATNNESVNERAYRDASALHILINVADRPEFCSFFLPSVVRRGKLSVAVSTEGSSPFAARRLRTDIEASLSCNFEEYLDLLNDWRARVIATLPHEDTRYLFWQQATDGRVLSLIEHNDIPAAQALLEGLLGDLSTSL
ncbi:MAG: bifunctional precorrin-2 dehydrogenase/sirohydrochlorin ferrochelatase [Raoultibacter sp.]